MTNDFFWEIPSTIDLEKILKNHPPDFSFKIDHFYYIIDYLWNAMVYNDLDENAGFVNLNAATLQRANHNYNKYLKYLLKHRFLRTDMKYIPGKKSFGFLLNTADSANIFVKRILINNWTIRRRMIKEIGEQNASFIKTQQDYPFLSKWFKKVFIKSLTTDGVP